MQIENILQPRTREEVLDDLKNYNLDNDLIELLREDDEAYQFFWKFFQRNWNPLGSEEKVREINELTSFIKMVIKSQENR